MCYIPFSGSPRWLSGKESACPWRRGGLGRSIYPWAGKISREETGCPLQYSCLENAIDRGAWRATVHGVANESDMT